MARQSREVDDMIEVRQAAVLVGRHPETIRRWVWSGRLTARRRGRRLLVARSEVQSLAGPGTTVRSLTEWAARARAARASIRPPASGGSAADLVTEDRLRRSGVRSHARR